MSKWISNDIASIWEAEKFNVDLNLCEIGLGGQHSDFRGLI